MAINMDKPQRWKKDIAKSVDKYNNWFLNFAPEAYRNSRINTTEEVRNTLVLTDNFRHLNSSTLRNNPGILSTLRMSTCPPIAIDRLIGLSGVPKNLVKTIEKYQKLPVRMSRLETTKHLRKLCGIISKLLDEDIIIWLDKKRQPTGDEVYRASTIIADRLCGSITNPIIRNAQEERQLDAIEHWLVKQGYKKLKEEHNRRILEMPQRSYGFHINVPVKLLDGGNVNVTVDVAIKRKRGFPILIEAKSAGDFTNVNKRRKEEVTKMSQLRRTYGKQIKYILFLCGYFDSGYLGFEASEGIDWIWEHRMSDLSKLL